MSLKQITVGTKTYQAAVLTQEQFDGLHGIWYFEPGDCVAPKGYRIWELVGGSTDSMADLIAAFQGVGWDFEKDGTPTETGRRTNAPTVEEEMAEYERKKAEREKEREEQKKYRDWMDVFPMGPEDDSDLLPLPVETSVFAVVPSAAIVRTVKRKTH